MKDFLTKTIRIGETELPMWIPIAAVGAVFLLVMIFTGEGPGTGSDWVTHNEG